MEGERPAPGHAKEVLNTVSPRPTDADSFSQRTELISALLMSIAVVVIAISAWEAALWSGRESLRYSQAAAARVQGNGALTQSLTEQEYDASVFESGVAEYFRGNLDAVNFLRSAMVREEFRPALEAWLEENLPSAVDPRAPLSPAPDNPSSPFDLPEYTNAKADEAVQLGAQADRLIGEAQQGNQNGDDHVLATTILSGVLFFTGVGSKFASRNARMVTLGLAAFALVAGLAWMLTLPKLFSTGL